MTPLLRIEGLRVTYGHHVAVDGLSLDLAAGQITAVVGESGSGKSTLAHAIIGLLPNTGRVRAGSIRLNGEEITGLSEKAWRSVRGRRIGLIPQDPGVALDPTKPVGRQVAEVLKVHNMGTGAGARALSVALLAEAGLPEPDVRARQFPHEMSGGMRQRVLIAMATAARPGLLIADEPTSALDVTVQRQILDHFEELAANTGTAVLLVTHDLAVAADRAQRIVVMSKARVVEAGSTQQVLHAPNDPYTRRLLADNLATARPRPPAAEGAEVLLAVRELGKTFPMRGRGPQQRRVAVDGVSFDVRRGQTFGLVGESGSGKTTTARLVLGLERATSGTVHLGEVDVTSASRAQLRRLHRRVQLIYQNPYASLNPRFTVQELLTEPLRNFGITGGPSVSQLLDDVALPASTAGRKAGELSGGQRQRVAIARALSLNPELVVCDEPVSALDVTVQAQILDLLVTLQQDRGLSYLFISHDLAVIRHVSDQVAVMHHGRIVETGTTEDIFAAPTDPYTKNLLDAIPGSTEEASWTLG